MNSSPGQSSDQAGFTLIEVMFALLILFGGLTVLLSGAATSVESTKRAQMMTVASELARFKMAELEEVLAREGFQETDQEDKGDFDDEGWGQMYWESKITKVDITNPEILLSLATGIPLGDPESEEESGSESMFADMLGGGTEGGIFSLLMPIVTNVLEQAIRKVHLRIFWKSGKLESDLNVDLYLTNLGAVNL